MDFTSDSIVQKSSSAAAVTERSSSSVEEGLLSEADLKAIRLHEQRESLLSTRNRLLQEIESLKSRQDEKVDLEDARILDLVLLASSEGNSAGAAGVETIDGTTDLQKELATKCDTLPLLNMQARLHCLQEFYAGVELKVKSLGDSTTIEVEARFKRQEPGFSVTLRLAYQDSVLLDCEIQDVAVNAKWQLRNLLQCKNPTKILLGCYEFDLICGRRAHVFDQLASAMSRYASLVTVEAASNSCMILTRSVPPAAVLRVQWLVDVDDMWPASSIATTLSNGSGEFIDIDQIKIGLFKEYGVTLGLQELCKACLCL